MSDINLEGLSNKQLRLFAVRCARRVQHLMPDPRSIAALNVAERHAKGEATDDELAAAWATAVAANAAVAAWATAVAANAAWAAAWAARDAAMDAAANSAGDAELAEQQKILDEIRKEEL